MQQIAYRLSAVIFIGVLICSPGCQGAGFPGFPGSARKSDQNDRPISSQQIADVKLTLAHSLEVKGELEPALAAYQQAIEKDPRRSTGYWRMAIIHDQQGETVESEKLYRKALKLDPKNPEIHCDYGYSLYLQRRWVEAEECLRKALDIKPKLFRAHNNLGLVLAQTEQPKDALIEFRRAGCDEADAHNNLAFVLTLNRRWIEARENYEYALEANPDSEVAATGLKLLDSVASKLSVASKRGSDPKPAPISLVDYQHAANESPEKNLTAGQPEFADKTSGRAAISTTDRDQ